MFAPLQFLFLLTFLSLFVGLFVFTKPFWIQKEVRVRGPNLSAFTGQFQNQLIQLKIKADAIAAKNDDVVSIIAYVSVPVDYPAELSYEWQLTENVHLVDGSLQSNLKKLEKNKIYPIEIKVSGFSQLENRQIVFKISGSHNGHRVSAHGIVASKTEDTFENVVKNVEKLRAENN